MNNLERQQLDTINKIAKSCNVNLVRMWREKRKGNGFINGRTLKFVVIDDNTKENKKVIDEKLALTLLTKFAETVKNEFNYVYHFSSPGCSRYNLPLYVSFMLG